jgi:fatty-acyl-CoA synthase
MNFNWVLDSVAGQVPVPAQDRVAVSFGARDRLTYGELRDRTLRYARALRELGLGRGDRLGLLLFNDPEYIPLYLAAARLGVITVRLNFRLAPAELRFILADSGCDVVIVHGSLAGKLGSVRDETGVRTCLVLPGSGGPGPGDAVPSWAQPFTALQGRDPLAPADAPEITDADPIALLYTSGTTGLPKGAIWTHGNTVGIASMQALKWQFSDRTVALVPGPLYHAGGFEAVLSPVLLTHGTAVCLESGGFTVDRLLEVVRAENVTDCLLFSFMLNELLRLPDLEAQVPASLRRFIVGSDTVMPWVFEEMERRLPAVELVQVYGLTEGGAIATTLDHDDYRKQPKSVGRPIPLTEVRVTGRDGALTAPGEVGEIEVRSPAVSTGYWQRPEASRETFAGGWCRTGDLGFVSADGFLTLAGRAKDMIRSGGENVYPAEVEKILTGYPGVKDVAVIGVPDDRYDEVGCAVIVSGPGGQLDAAALGAYCREHLAGYKVPKHFRSVGELPRNASGKVLKYVLREQYRQEI